MVEALANPIKSDRQMGRPQINSTLEVAGVVKTGRSPPYFSGDSRTIKANGAERAKNSHSEVVETTFTPAMFRTAQTMTTASPTITPRWFTENQGNSRVR